MKLTTHRSVNVNASKKYLHTFICKSTGWKRITHNRGGFSVLCPKRESTTKGQGGGGYRQGEWLDRVC